MAERSPPKRFPSNHSDALKLVFHLVPYKDLARAKCVNKLWCALIPNRPAASAEAAVMGKLFALRLAPERVNKARPLCKKPQIWDYEGLRVSGDESFEFLSRSFRRYPAYNFELIPTNVDGMGERFPEIFIAPYCIVGSCGGLICLSTLVGPVVWNPHTRSFRIIMRPKLARMYFWGFGYDDKIQDYKFVMGDFKEVCIFELKKGHWRFVKGSKLIDAGYVTDTGFLFNHALHWIGHDDDGGLAIIKLDLRSDCFEVACSLEATCNQGYKVMIDNVFGVADNCLCYYSSKESDCDQTITIWTVKEQGHQIFHVIDLRRFSLQLNDFKTITILNDRHVLMQVSYCLMLYDIKDNKFVSAVDGIDEITTFEETLAPVAYPSIA